MNNNEDIVAFDHWRYSAMSVTKYNPQYRDEERRYTRDEWTDYSCVGLVINGKEVTYQEYEVVEQSYIQAVRLFLQYHDCNELILCHVEKYDDQEFEERDIACRGLWSRISDGYIVSEKEIEAVVQMILRSYIWGELLCSANKEIAVRFGYDYYMYFNNVSGKLPSELRAQIESMGLFVEED